MRNISILLIFSLLLTSCTFTRKLYKVTDPNEYVMVKYDQITEEYLIEKNIKYFKDDENKIFYIEKNNFQKLKDYSYRTIGTPITVILDTTIIVAVAAGALVVSALIGAAEQNGEEEVRDREKRWGEY